jgi:P pilus assembly chaperone PapD
LTIDVNADIGPEKDVSMRVVSVSGRGLVVERPVFFARPVGAAGAVTGGSVEHGETSPRDTYLFGEGSTRAGFQSYLTLQNPEPFSVHVRIVYALGATEQNITSERDLPPSSRQTIDVNAAIGPERDVSFAIFAAGPIIVERPTYFNRAIGVAGQVAGGAATLGVGTPAKVWRFAEGSTRSGIQTYLTLLNPTPSPVTVNVTYLFTDQAPSTQSVVVQAASRATVDANAFAGPERDVSMLVQASGNIVAERPTYFARPIGAAGLVRSGANAIGSPSD